MIIIKVFTLLELKFRLITNGLTKSETNKWIEFVNRIAKAMEFEVDDQIFSLSLFSSESYLLPNE